MHYLDALNCIHLTRLEWGKLHGLDICKRSQVSQIGWGWFY